MRWSIHKITFIALLGLFLFGLIGIYTATYEKKIYYKDLDVALKEKATKNYLDQKIINAINSEQFDDAVMYQHLADYMGVNLSQHTLDEIENHSGFFSESWRNTKDFSWGFLTGEADNLVGISGTIASDMTMYGDLRDLSIEGSRFANNQPYDKVVLGMSAIGIGLSASQIFSLGTTTPLKISASIVKVAKKTKYLSNSFVAVISSKLSKAIDFNRLKKVDFSSIESVKKASKYISKSLNDTFIRKALKNIDTIKSKTSIADTIVLLKYVDDPKDLQRVANISKRYKTNTKAVFKILGKRIIKGIVKGSAKIIKWTNMLIAQLISFAISILSFMIIIRKIVLHFIDRFVGVSLALMVKILKRISQ